MSLSSLLAKVVRFTNISNEHFEANHAFDDAPSERYSFAPGASKVMPYVIARHLAKHLARKMLLDGSANLDPRSKARIFGKEDVERMIPRILSEVNHDSDYQISDTANLVKERIASLNQEVSPEPVAHSDSPAPVLKEQEDPRSKGEILNELRGMGAAPDARKSKMNLLSELSQLKSQD